MAIVFEIEYKITYNFDELWLVLQQNVLRWRVKLTWKEANKQLNKFLINMSSYSNCY